MIQCLRDSLGWPLVNSYSEDVLQIPLDNYLDVCEGENLNNKELINALLQDKEDCVCGYGGLKVGELRSREAPSVLRLDTLGHICNNSRFQEGKVITKFNHHCFNNTSVTSDPSSSLANYNLLPFTAAVIQQGVGLAGTTFHAQQDCQAGVNILAFKLLT